MLQRTVVSLGLGIVVCLQASGCSGRSPPNGTTATKAANRWSQEVDRYWAADLFFDDPQVLQLCEAIREKDYEQIDRLVKVEGVDINATGRMNITPLFWAFPLGYAEAFDKIPRDVMGGHVDSEVIPTLREFMGQHARLLEHLLKLGADPNIRTTRGEVAEMFKEGKPVIVPAHLFQVYEGFAVTHLASQPLTRARFNYFPLIMANGGDPNLAALDGRTPILVACGLSLRLEGGWPSPENVAILVDAGADLEVCDSDGSTPILKAAEYSHFDLVYMLIHAGADLRAKNKRGEHLPALTLNRKTLVAERTALEVNPYFLEVVQLLKEEGMLPPGIYEPWREQIDRLIENCGDERARGHRDPFVEEWVAKRGRLEASSERDGETPKAKAAREGE